MSTPDNEPIDPFRMARRRASVDASIQILDVRALRPWWSEQQAREFLEENAAVLAHSMLVAGEQTLRQLLEHSHDP